MSQPRPNKFSQLVPVFDGGLNTKFTDDNTPLNMSPELKNVAFDDYGAVSTVEGYSPLNTAPIGSAPVDGLHSFVDPSRVRRLMAVCDGSLWVVSGASETTFVTVASSQGVYTSGVDVKMFTHEGKVFLQNGYARPYKYDGTYFTQAGVSAVTAGLASAVSDGTGALDGDYRWAMTCVNTAAAESDYSLLNTATVAISNGQVNITGIPDYPASAGCNTKNLYRTTGAAGGIYYLVTSLSATQSAVTDNAADNTLATTEAPSDHNTMPKGKYMTENLGYLFVAGDPDNPTRVYYSTVGEPEYWPAANALDIGEKDGQDITGLTTFGNTIVVHKSDGRGKGSIWLIYMPDSTSVTGADNWYVTKSNSAYGGGSDKAIAFYSGMLAFVAKQGMYNFVGEDIALNPAESKIGKFGVEAASYTIEPDILNIPKDYLDKAAMIDYNNVLYLAIPYGSDATGNNRIYLYDYSTISQPDRQFGAWSYMSAPSVNNFTEYNGDLYAGSSDDTGYIYKLNQDGIYTFNSEAIESYYWTALITGLDEHKYFDKVWRWLFITLDATGDWDLLVTYREDALHAGNTVRVDLNPGGNNWGEMIYRTDLWGTGLAKKRIRIPIRGMLSKSIQVKFETNTVDHHWKVYQIELFYNLRRDR